MEIEPNEETQALLNAAQALLKDRWRRVLAVTEKANRQVERMTQESMPGGFGILQPPPVRPLPLEPTPELVLQRALDIGVRALLNDLTKVTPSECVSARVPPGMREYHLFFRPGEGPGEALEETDLTIDVHTNAATRN